ncbi:MAG: DMT family transporter [Candidatus Dormibacteria bacterium]
MTAEAAVALALVFLAGMSVGLQSALLGAIRMRRGVLGSTRISYAGTLAGGAAILAVQGGADRLHLLISAVAVGIALGLLIRGMPPAVAVVGLLGLFYITATGNGVTKLGVGVTVAAVVAGQMFASLLLDAGGALGMARRSMTLPRAAGAVLLVAGVALIRLG